MLLPSSVFPSRIRQYVSEKIQGFLTYMVSKLIRKSSAYSRRSKAQISLEYLSLIISNLPPDFITSYDVTVWLNKVSPTETPINEDAK
jgi:hypothetical protein